MTIQLRDYQQEAIAKVRQALKHHRRVMLQLPTGAGKTVIGSFMMGSAGMKGLRSWFVVHRRELVEQTTRALEKMELNHGHCATGFPPRYNRPITVCSVQTLARRMERLPAPDMIVWDEAHHAAAGTWKKIAEAYPDAYHIGLSATPQRLDGKGLDTLFTALVPGPSVRWLIEQGHLSQYRAWSQPLDNRGSFKMRGADFDVDAIAADENRRVIIGDAVDHYLEICPGKQAVAFCCNVKEAIATRDMFREAGVVSEELDGTADGATRKRVVKAFRDGKIQVLTSVDLFGEGFDLPELSAAIMLRPTQSLGLHLQQVGRALRVAPGKDMAYLLDHAGNIHQHGLPDDDREWSLKTRKKRGGGETPYKTCDVCFATCPPSAKKCDVCGHEFEIAEREGPQTVDGRLVELDLERMRAIAAKDARKVETFEELVEIAIARKHRSPHMFALGVMKSRGRADEVSHTQVFHALESTRVAYGYKRGWVLWHLQNYKNKIKGEAA